MRRVLLPVLGVVSILFAFADAEEFPQSHGNITLPKPVTETIAASEWTLVIHGGAGVIRRENMTAELEMSFRNGLEEALFTGRDILQSGGSSLDAVEAVVIRLENHPHFNAGRGAVLNEYGIHELDASIMDGRDLNAGAVAGVKLVKNPISAARIVMEKSEHVMFAGSDADSLAHSHGLELVENSYFTTPERLDALERVLTSHSEKRDKRGTVGAVAIDMFGNISAATSTGGMTAKKSGRVGDSPIVGAGVYADNKSCGVSTTGHGEFFIRTVAAKSICDRIKLLGETPAQASSIVLNEIAELGGDGGAIIISHSGETSLSFNTPGMFRGFVSADGNIETRIYGD